MADKGKAKPKKRGFFWFVKKVGFVLITLILIGLTTTAMCGRAFLYYIDNYVRPQAEIDMDIESLSMKFNSVIYYTDKKGEEKILQTLKGDENREWADNDVIPKQLKDAFVAIEDKRFYEHQGVDWRRTAGAALNWVMPAGDSFGGSTITQQLIKNVTDDDDYSVKRKVKEIIRALTLEEKLSKQEILEMYMNVIYFGENAYGVEMAALTYFDKSVQQLDLAECAMIAGLTQNPESHDPYKNPEEAKQRQKAVLGQMLEQGYISQREHDSAVSEELKYQRGRSEAKEGTTYSYFTDMVIYDVINDLMEQKGYSYEYAKTMVSSGGLSIYTTVDLNVQHKMEKAYENPDNFPNIKDKKGNQLESAMVVLNPKNGYVLGVVGGRGEKDDSLMLNRATQTPRSPGSTIKPLSVYAPAMDAKLITPYSVVEDMPSFKSSDDSAWPKNENRTYKGLTTIMDGVANSTNTVAVKVLKKLTTTASYDFMTEKLGIPLVDEDKNYGGLALGGLTEGVSVRDMAQGYTALANYGKFSTAKSYTKVLDIHGATLLTHEDEKPTQVFKRTNATPQYVNDVLTNVVEEGTGKLAAIEGMDVAGKTGTTSNNVDRWFAGYTPYYVGVCWVGFDSSEGLPDLVPNPAVEAWSTVMNDLHAGKEPKQFKQSKGFVEQVYCADSGRVPTSICRSDVRGGRVRTGSFFKNDVPMKECQLHQWYRGTALLDLERKFKVPIEVSDEYYCFTGSHTTKTGKGERVKNPYGYYYYQEVDRRIAEAEAAAAAAAAAAQAEAEAEANGESTDDTSSYGGYGGYGGGYSYYPYY